MATKFGVLSEMLFDIENRHMANIINRNLDKKTITYFSGEAKKIILTFSCSF